MGEFRDEDGLEWEEYVDKDTSEYFYWNEEGKQSSSLFCLLH